MILNNNNKAIAHFFKVRVSARICPRASASCLLDAQTQLPFLSSSAAHFSCTSLQWSHPRLMTSRLLLDVSSDCVKTSETGRLLSWEQSEAKRKDRRENLKAGGFPGGLYLSLSWETPRAARISNFQRPVTVERLALFNRLSGTVAAGMYWCSSFRLISDVQQERGLMWSWMFWPHRQSTARVLCFCNELNV